MPSIETSIWLALKARVQAFVPEWGAFDPATQVSWPNIAFTKPQGGTPKAMLPYLRVTHVPNLNRRLFLAGSDPHQRLGLLQVDVFAKKNQPSAVAVEIAGQVAAWFPPDLQMTYGDVTVRVTAAPTVAQPMDDDTHVLVPVTVPVECFA